MKLALLFLLTLLVPARSDACSHRDFSIFERFELAKTVAHVRVRVVPPGGAGRVHLDVKKIVKGEATKRLVTFETNTSCSVGFKKNQQAIVFLAEDGRTIAHGMGYVTEVKTWDALVDAWAAATEVERRMMIVDAIVKDEDPIAHDAALYLAETPGFLAKLDKDQRAQLAAVTPKSKYSALQQVRERLAGGKYEAEQDVAKLAAIIVAGKGEKDPDRIAALERCERIRGKRLASYMLYRAGAADHYWIKLAEACKTGTPAS